MKNSKPVFKKMKLHMDCWYCGRKADGTFNFSNGDEIPVCFVCASQRGKTKGHRRSFMKQAVLGKIPVCEQDKTAILKEKSDGN